MRAAFRLLVRRTLPMCPLMRAFAVCPACCEVYRTGAPCPTCAGVPIAGEDERSIAIVFNPPRPRRALSARVLGLGLALVALVGAVTLWNG
jgi:hypothetical protein